MAAFGLHFGSCSACLAVYRDGRTEVVANDLGDRVTPCVVAFTDHEAAVGAAAKQGIIRNSTNTVSHVKRILGCKMMDKETQEYIQKSSVKISNKKECPVYEVEHIGRQSQFTPSQILELIYKKMLETARSHGGSGSQDTVLAVPCDFTQEQRNLISNTAQKAGFNVLRVINEPSAALLAFDIGQLDQTEKFKTVVYRLGGTSHDATVMEIEHGMFRVVARASEMRFGGDRFTEVLQDFLTTEFNRQYRCDMKSNKRSMTKLGLAAERCKHSLSTLSNAQCAVESLFDGCDFHYNMSRARFDSLILPLISRCTQLIEDSLVKAGCTKDNISKLIICGGGAKPPLVKKVVQDCFSSATLLNNVPEDEIIAIGAAKEAALLVGDNEENNIGIDQQDTVEFKSLPKSVCLKLNKDDLEVVLPQNSLAPTRRQHTLTLPTQQTNVALEVFQAEEPIALETAQLLARVVLRDLPPGSTIKSSFHLKREGDLHITCQEVTSEKMESITIPCH